MMPPVMGVAEAPRLQATIHMFIQDLVDEGYATSLGRIVDSGVTGVAVAATYHHARDITPHNPKRRVLFQEGDVAYFRPDPSRYRSTQLRPKPSQLTVDNDPFERLVHEAKTRGVAVTAWVVTLHNLRLGLEFPSVMPMTAWGDRMPGHMCPSNPDARGYVVGLVDDIARFELEAIELEAAAFPSFEHGHHHERSFVALSALARYLLGLCFCSHCRSAAVSHRLDIDRIAGWVRAVVDTECEGGATARARDAGVDEAELRDACEGDVGRFLDLRTDTVTSLTVEMAQAVRSRAPQTSLVYLEPSGGTLGYATGRPTISTSAADLAWRDGVSLSALADVCDRIALLGYFADVDRLLREIAAYRACVPSIGRLGVVLRPMLPDTVDRSDLIDKVRRTIESGIVDLSFYHYGLMPLENLEWVRSALLAAGHGHGQNPVSP